MSRHRHRAGEHPAYDPSFRDADGSGQCRRCLAPLHTAPGEFCSPACVQEFRIRASAHHMRRALAAASDGTCASCGVHVLWLDRIQAALDRRLAPDDADATRLWMLDGIGLPATVRRASVWHADHIRPVMAGGGECGLDNLRLLCVPCHRAVTRAMHGRLRAARRHDPRQQAIDFTDAATVRS